LQISLICVLLLFVKAALSSAALPNDPAPPPDRATGNAPTPTRTGRLIGLLHKLVDYGKDLIHSLQQRPTAAAPHVIARNFGTMNVALILLRILRGLRLATALEARLVSHPVREAPPPVRAPSDRAPRTAQPAEPRPSRAASQLPDIPTAEDIAEALRHRPVGAVIADICRDLGIVPSHPLWGDILMAVTEFGGNFVRLFKDTLDRIGRWFLEACALENASRPAPLPQAVAACCTGPP
jgi:hypothetical protein